MDAIITLEPTATRLVARGAREIARVADIWKQATGQKDDPILLGLAASRSWYEANRTTAAKLTALFQRVNGFVRREPSSLLAIASEVGLKPDETKAAELLGTQRAATLQYQHNLAG